MTLDKTFTIMHSSFKNNFSIFEESKVNDQRKLKATSQLFNRNVTKLKGYFDIWRTSAHKMKLALLEKYMRNFNVENFNKRFLREALFLI